MNRTYICIDLKSFYASVECVERNLDPLKTNLVVADESRTEKTVCLAVTPSLKQYGLGGRSRLYEVLQKVKEINYQRRKKIKYKKFTAKSTNDDDLKKNDYLELDFIIASPRMSLYMEYSTKIYNIYLKYVSKEDIYPYSIDEVFCDITDYLNLYKTTPEELVGKIIKDVYEETKITSTAGIGTNLFLCKVAMDIVAKHKEANECGVRIATLDEDTFRKELWNHEPITDFWRVGKGYAEKLKQHNIKTMGDIALMSTKNEDMLYKLFGINAELLIDHAWGYESATIKSIKSCKRSSKSISSGQVLHCPYNYEKTKIIIREMIELMSLDLVDKKYITDLLVLHIDYDVSNIKINKYSNIEIKLDNYGRKVPKPAHGTIRLKQKTSSTKLLTESIMKLYEKITNKKFLIRKINICAADLENEEDKKENIIYEQFNLFTNIEEEDKKNKIKKENIESEKKVQHVILDLKKKYGKNIILKGMNLEEGATTIDRNNEIGGHRA